MGTGRTVAHVEQKQRPKQRFDVKQRGDFVVVEAKLQGVQIGQGGVAGRRAENVFVEFVHGETLHHGENVGHQSHVVSAQHAQQLDDLDRHRFRRVVFDGNVIHRFHKRHRRRQPVRPLLSSLHVGTAVGVGGGGGVGVVGGGGGASGVGGRSVVHAAVVGIVAVAAAVVVVDVVVVAGGGIGGRQGIAQTCPYHSSHHAHQFRPHPTADTPAAGHRLHAVEGPVFPRGARTKVVFVIPVPPHLVPS